ncbi:MaoC family dehydratase [Natrononativus amylolyticus]|uniref:MaoC family dehydratase n=1 Tax=Natrononativus amylolyticus TaxID=2963434 RepID=UPI0020CFDF1E|nr:MaoC family dehydratase [Natrononativus amylolyticus]
MTRQRAETNVAELAAAWTSVTGQFVKSAAAANRAAVSAMFPQTDGPAETENRCVEPAVPSLEYSALDWTFERTVDDRAELGVGDAVTFEKTLSEDDVHAFARVSGDTNRLHLDEAFAAETRFGERIAHGTLVSGLISAALARLPGLTIYLSQDLEFRGPVRIGDRVSARVEIVEDLGDGQYRLETRVRDEDADETVVDGEAVVLIDELPDA